MVRRYGKIKAVTEGKTKWIVTCNFSEPPCSSHHLRFMFSVSQTASPSISTKVIHFFLTASVPLFPPLLSMQFLGFTCHIIHSVVDRKARIGALIKIMTKAPICILLKMLLDKGS